MHRTEVDRPDPEEEGGEPDDPTPTLSGSGCPAESDSLPADEDPTVEASFEDATLEDATIAESEVGPDDRKRRQSLRKAHDEAIRRFKQNLSKNDRFELIREIGVGGMGVVFEAHDRQQDAHVALKTMIRLQPNQLYRFKREFRSLANLVHPNLVSLHELFSDGEEWFYTMELIDGGLDFISWTRPPPDPDELGDDATVAMDEAAPADTKRLREALAQLIEGVHALHHEGKLHRDIKPPNVLVDPEGRVQLVDFGLIKDVGDADRDNARKPLDLAREYFAHSVATHGGISGSIGYMSPEQGSDGEVTEASDWYGVGVILFEALTGRRPFLGSGWNVLAKKQQHGAPSPDEIAAGLPADLVSLCRALLSRDPAERLDAIAAFGTSEAGTANGSAVEREELRLPFFGRESHLERIRGAFTRVAAGTTTMIHLHGRSGAGKSALANRFLTGIEGQENVIVLAGRCFEQESVPYKALDAVVDSLSRHLLERPADEVEALAPPDIAALARIFPVLERVEAIRDAPPRNIADPFELRRVAFRAFEELLRRIGDRRELVLYIDDLQWGDSDSATFLRELIESRFPPRLLFIASYRSEYRDRSPCLRALPKTSSEGDAPMDGRVWIENLEVGPLSDPEARGLAASLLDGSDETRATRIAGESGGNPYFIYELASLGNLEIARESDGETFSPLDLDEALWARVSRLAETPRRLLEVIAVSSRPTSIRRIYEAAGVHSSGQPGMAELRAGHLVRRDGPGLDDPVESFHDRIRETILSNLDRTTLSRHHLGLARSLENDPEADPEVVAIHFRGAGEFELAGRFFLLAAERASRALAFERAAKLYRQTLRLRHLDEEDTRVLRIRLAEALGNAGRGAESATTYLLAARGLSGDRAHRLQERAGYQFCVAGCIDEGRDCFRGVLRHLGLRLPATRRSALVSLIWRRLLLLARGIDFRRREEADIPENLLNRIDLSWAVAGGITVIDPIPAAEFQTHNLLLALRAGEPFRVTRALAWEASHLAMVGRRFESRVQALLDKATTLALELEEPLARGTVDLARSVAAFFLGDFPSCREYGDSAAEVFRKECAGSAWELEQSQTFAYWACYWLGDIDELSRRHESLLTAARDRGANLAESQLSTFGGPFVWLARDTPDTAREALARATDHWSDVEYQVYHYTALTAKTQIALYEGRGREALRMMREEWPLVAGALLLHVELVRVYMHFLRSRCALAAAESADDPGPFLSAAAEDARALLRLRPNWSKAAGAQTLAAIALARGKRYEAITKLERAVDGFEREHFGLHAWCARHCLDRITNGASSAETAAWFESQGIRDPARMVAVNAPGFGIEPLP